MFKIPSISRVVMVLLVPLLFVVGAILTAPETTQAFNHELLDTEKKTTLIQSPEPITQTLREADVRGGVDLVFVVDNSSSMYHDINESCGIEGDVGNDEKGYRFDIIESFVDILGYSLVSEKEFDEEDGLSEGGEKIDHRIGVVTFGGPDTSSIDLGLRSLAVSSDGSLEILRGDLMQQVSRGEKYSTHPYPAFEQAAQIFAQASPAPEPRTRGVILLTDGLPALTGCAFDPAFLDRYMTDFQNYLQNSFPQAPTDQAVEGYHLWVIAMNEDWFRVQPYWEAVIGNRWQQIDSADDIIPSLWKIIEKIYPLCATESSCLIDENFVMPPYVQQATFSIFSNNSDALQQFKLFDEATPLDLTDPNMVSRDTQIGESTRRITIRQPSPGEWQYEGSSLAKVTVRLDPIFGKLRLDSSNKNQLSAIPIEFQLLSNDNELINEYKGYKLNINTTVTDPDGNEVKPIGGGSKLTFQSDGQGTYRSNERIALMLTGTYRVEMIGESVDLNGNSIRVLPKRKRTFHVGAIDAQVILPEHSLTPLSEVDLKLQVVGADGEPVRVAVGGDVKVEAMIEPLGDTSGDPHLMRFVTDDSGMFVPESGSSIANLLPGSYDINADGWLDKGSSESMPLFTAGKTLEIDSVTARLQEPALPLAPFKETNIVYEMINSAGDPIEINPDSGVEVALTVVTPSGRSITEPMTLKDGNFEFPLFISEAGPGEYTVSARGMMERHGSQGQDELFVTSQKVLNSDSIELVLIEPTSENKPVEHSDREISFEFRDSRGKRVVPDPANAPDFTGSVLELPDGSTQPLNLVRSSNGVFESHFTASKPGNWTVKTKASLTGSDGKKQQIAAAQQAFKFEVLDGIPVGVHIEKPQKGERFRLRDIPRACLLPCSNSDPIEFVVNLINEDDGQKIQYKSVTTTPAPDQFSISVTTKNDKSVGRVTWGVDPTDGSRLIGQIEGLDQPTEYELEVEVNETLPSSRVHAWDSDNREDEIKFSRQNTLVDTVIGWAIELSIITAVLLFLLFLLALFWYSRPSQRLSGRLEFRPQGVSMVVPVPIESRYRFRPWKTVSVPSLGIYGISQIKVRRAGDSIEFKIQINEKLEDREKRWFEGQIRLASRRAVRVGKKGAIDMTYIATQQGSKQ